MGLADLTDPTGVRAAMDECAELGRDVSKKYGFRERRRYVVERDAIFCDAGRSANALR